MELAPIHTSPLSRFRGKGLGDRGWCLLVSLFLISLFSACSPLYPLQPWDDPDVFMSIGKSVLSGKLMYHDIYDQKGPVLFFMHEIAAWLSYTSFLGIYVVECICMFFFLRYGLKTMRLFSDSQICLPLMCLMGLVTATSDCFYYGDSVEEFCLPLLAQCMYYMLAYIKRGTFPTCTQAFIVGIEAGLIFWTKFNIMIFYGGGFLALAVVAFVRQRKTRTILNHSELSLLLSTAMFVIAGMIPVTIGVLAYFACHGTLADLFQSYFYNNLFMYGDKSANGEPDVWWFPLVKLSIWLVLMLPVLMPKVRWEVKLLVSMTYGLLLLTFATMTVQLYYFVLLFAFSPLVIYRFRNARLSRKSIAIMISIAIWQTIFNWNVVTLVMGTFPTKVLGMVEIIDQNHSNDSRVLNFSSYDTGVYVLSQRQLPPNRHFFLPNILSDEIRQEQRQWVESGKVKYLVRWIGSVKTTHDYYAASIPDNYHLIYDGTENYRYRFYTTPTKYLWNLVWTRPIMSAAGIIPEVEPQHMMLYERRP